MRSRAPLLIALLVLLNFVGSPMAWAHWLGDGESHPASSAQAAPESCHGHMAPVADDSAPAPDAMPCCEGGDCSCAAPALSPPLVTQPAHTPRPERATGLPSAALPASPIDDPLRPPIR